MTNEYVISYGGKNKVALGVDGSLNGVVEKYIRCIMRNKLYQIFHPYIQPTFVLKLFDEDNGFNYTIKVFKIIRED